MGILISFFLTYLKDQFQKPVVEGNILETPHVSHPAIQVEKKNTPLNIKNECQMKDSIR
jgi:hypothetical protein